MRARNALGIAACLLCTVPVVLRAQESLLPAATWGLAPTFATWSFKTPLEQSIGGVKSVTQLSVPIRGRFTFGGRWNLEGSAAFASSTASVGSGDAVGDIKLSGLTDARIRLSGPIIGDAVLLTAGVNLPSGTTGLDAAETGVLQLIGAPALGMPVSALGLGAGGTLGLVVAKQAGEWAVALGGSAEQRSEYTAVELALADGGSLTKVKPGMAWHVTLGADRALGEHRLAFVLIEDGFSEDLLTTGDGSDEDAETRYTLGSQFSAIARLDVARAGWREGAATFGVRMRSAFSDAAGEKVDGSDAKYIEASLMGVRGGAVGRGLIFGLDARYHTGMTFSDALVAAAASTAGVTLGIELPASSAMLRIAAHAQYGQFDTGATKSNGFGLSLTGVVAARRDSR